MSLFPAASPVLQAEVARLLTAEDKAIMATTKVGSTTPKLKRVRAVHHAAARLLATGMKAQQVSATTGLCPSRLSILQNDPAFKELMDFYINSEQERFTAVQDRMVMLGMVASEELTDRISEGAEDVSTKDLTEILKASLDRGGYAPIARSESKNLHVTLGADQLALIKQTVKGEQNGQVVKRPATTQALPKDLRAGVDSIDPKRPVFGAEEIEGLTLEGLGL